jgi:hypothetical protein
MADRLDDAFLNPFYVPLERSGGGDDRSALETFLPSQTP